MAAKQGRTKGKNWNECTSSNDDDDDDNDDINYHLASRYNELTKRREKKKRKLKKRNIGTDSNTDSSSDIDINKINKKKLKALLKNFSRSKFLNVKDFSCSPDSKSDQIKSNDKKNKELRVNPVYKKPLSIKHSSESDAAQSDNNIKSKKLKNLQHNSDSSISSKSAQHKLKNFKSKFRFEECFIDHYSIIGTPTRSDDEIIPVNKNQETSLKHCIIDQVEKIKKITAELESNLEFYSDYLINKKINVVRDSKFIAHKILRIYDLIYEKLKTNRNNFADIYREWLSACNRCTPGKMENIEIDNNFLSVNQIKEQRDINETEASISKNSSQLSKSPKVILEKQKLNSTEHKKSIQGQCSDNKKNDSSTSDCESNNRLTSQNSQEANVKKINQPDVCTSSTDVSSNSLNKNSKSNQKQERQKKYLSESEEGICKTKPLNNIEDKLIIKQAENISNYREEAEKMCKPALSHKNRSFCSSNDDIFATSLSEVANTSTESSSLKTLIKKELLSTCNETKILSNESNDSEVEGKSASQAVNDIVQSEQIALNSLLQDSDDTDYEKDVNDADVCAPVQKNDSVAIEKISEDNGPSSSDFAGGSNRKKKSRLENDDDLPPRYRRRQAFNVQKNPHYKAIKKLRKECRVTLERLSQNVLENYSKDLENSKKYVANKMFHSITNLDGLETKRKSKKMPISSDSFSSDKGFITAKSKHKKSNETNPIVECMEEDNESDVSAETLDNDNDNETRVLLHGDDVEDEINDDAENKAKEDLLKSNSDSSSENSTFEAMEEEEGNMKTLKNNCEAKSIIKDEASVGESDEYKDKMKKKSSWTEDELLHFTLTDSESEEEKPIHLKTKNNEENDKSNDEETTNQNASATTPIKKKKQRKLLIDSDSEAKYDSSNAGSSDKEVENEEEKEDGKKKKSRKREKSSESDTSTSEKKQKSKRKRIKKVATDSESDDQDSPGKGRKNIRKVLKDKHVADDTRKAAQDEEERLKRIAERQRLFNEMYDARLAGEAKVDKLVLDFDEETKKELVVVNEQLVKRLKPHQAKGIKFMWDACFESLKQIEKSDGSGCIIAHCMGLGKSFQVVTLSYTLLSHEETKVRTIMVVCPLSTVLNWVNEFKIWLKHVKNGDDIEIYELTKMKKNIERKYQLQSWQRTGGVLIIGYEMFRNLTSTGKKMRKAMQESIMKSLVDPGADLVVCDEGHLLKNEDSALSKAMKLVKTLRRIVLTGTPLQNNLKEYHCMVQFVKPNLLGSKKEFLNRFVNPITNGQFDDSTPHDVKLMKKRAHVLHKMLEGSVQRFDYSVLTPFLPPKQEYVIFVRLTDVQIKMYQHYLDNLARRFGHRNGSLFADFQELQRIWTHPYVLRLNAEKVEKANEKKRFEASDSEGSLKDFIDDDSDSESNSGSETNSDIQSIHSDTERPMKLTRSARMNIKAEELEEVIPIQETAEESAWWSKYIEKEHFLDLRISTKLILLFGILKESEQIGDKVLVFSQSLYSLTLIEEFLNLIDQETQNNVEAEHLDKHTGNWALGLDYFRLDGSTSAENRSAWCKIFNNPTNTRARLFLISTRAGGLGINLTAANRVIIFDASWNPSHDVQSIFRIYRFGQKKPCYVYRFLAAGTMEEKIYNRQVTKLSLACRVVDEQQIERHYSNNDLAELYQFESYEGKSVTLNLPKDRLLAEIFLKYKDAVYNYHEHDSLLENKQEEELDEEERKQAWLEYEEEKQGKRQMINMGNNIGFNQMVLNMNSFPELENIKMLIQKDYPNLPPEHLETVARQAVYDMYRYVDQQAVNQQAVNQGLNPFAAMQGMQMPNMFGAPPMPPMNQQQQQYNTQSHLMSMLNQPQMNYPGVNHMPVYSGRGRPPKHMSINNPLSNMRPMQTPMHLQQPQQPQQPQQVQQVQQGQRQAISNTDEVEILDDLPLTSPNIESVSNTKNIQKE